MKKIIVGTLLTIMIAGFYAFFNNHISKATSTNLLTSSKLTSIHFPTLKETQNITPIQVNQKEKSNGVTLTLKTVRYGKDQFNKGLLEMYFVIEESNLKDTMERIKKSKDNLKIKFEKSDKNSGVVELHEKPLSTYSRPRLSINERNQNFWCAMDFKEISNNKYAGLLQIHLENNQPKHFKANMYFFNVVSQQGHWEFDFQI